MGELHRLDRQRPAAEPAVIEQVAVPGLDVNGASSTSRLPPSSGVIHRRTMLRYAVHVVRASSVRTPPIQVSKNAPRVWREGGDVRPVATWPTGRVVQRRLRLGLRAEPTDLFLGAIPIGVEPEIEPWTLTELVRS